MSARWQHLKRGSFDGFKTMALIDRRNLIQDAFAVLFIPRKKIPHTSRGTHSHALIISRSGGLPGALPGMPSGVLLDVAHR